MHTYTARLVYACVHHITLQQGTEVNGRNPYCYGLIFLGFLVLGQHFTHTHYKYIQSSARMLDEEKLVHVSSCVKRVYTAHACIHCIIYILPINGVLASSSRSAAFATEQLSVAVSAKSTGSLSLQSSLFGSPTTSPAYSTFASTGNCSAPRDDLYARSDNCASTVNNFSSGTTFVNCSDTWKLTSFLHNPRDTHMLT